MWLAHNKAIFDPGNVNPKSTVAKSQEILKEALKTRVKGHNISLMEQKEKDWLSDPLMRDET